MVPAQPLLSVRIRQPTTVGGQPYVKVVDLPRFFKDRPSLDESPQYLAGWLAGYFAADGCVAADGTVILNSADRSNLEFVRDVCTRLGSRHLRHHDAEPARHRRSPERPAPGAPHRRRSRSRTSSCCPSTVGASRSRQKAFHRRGWVVRSVEPTDRVEEVYLRGRRRHARLRARGQHPHGQLLRLPEERRRDHVHSRARASRLRRGGRATRRRAPGITLRYDDASFSKDRKRKQRLHEAVAAAIDFYHQLLLDSRDAGTARRYLRSRGFDGDVARRFSLGWSPDGFDALSAHLQKQKFSRDDIVDAGLAFVNKANKLQDSFRGRVMFPIWDTRGEPVGFGGRTLDAQGPKYKNTAETRALPEVAVALRPALGEGRDRRARRGRDLRGLHRRDGVRARGRAERGRDVRHRARRRALPHAEEPRPQGRCSRTTPTAPAKRPPNAATSGSSATRCSSRSPISQPVAIPADVWRDDPRSVGERGEGRDAVPRVPHRAAARGVRPVDASRAARAPASARRR